MDAVVGFLLFVILSPPRRHLESPVGSTSLFAVFTVQDKTNHGVTTPAKRLKAYADRSVACRTTPVFWCGGRRDLCIKGRPRRSGCRARRL